MKRRSPTIIETLEEREARIERCARAGRLGGLKSGRSKVLSAERRREIAVMGARARWRRK